MPVADGNPRRSNGHRRDALRARVLARDGACWMCGLPIDRSLPNLHPCQGVVDVLEVVSREVSPIAAEALELWSIDRAGTWTEVAEEMRMSRREVCRARDLAFAWCNHNIVFANHTCPRIQLD